MTPPEGPVLTTQLFFPGAQRNRTDRIFDPRLLVDAVETEDGYKGYKGDFNFVVRAAE